MSDRPRTDPDAAPASAAEQAARDAVRGLAPPRAEATFRARLRREFTTGQFGPRRAVVSRPWWSRPQLLAPVAAALVAMTAVSLNRGPDWQLIAANGEGQVSVDGAVFSPRDAALGERLRRGGHVRVDGAITLDLVAPGVAAVALAPGAELELSSAPGRWWARDMRADVANGDTYFTTGRAFHGAHLDVSTPEVSVRAVGTAFAVLRENQSTCVCVMEGRVRVGEAGTAYASAVEVPAGMRRIVHADRTSETQPILDDSVHRLHRQRDVAGGLLGR